VYLDPTTDQELFVETSRRFIESGYPLTEVRANGPDGGDSAYRSQAASLGWFAMLVPEELGGGSVSGNGVLDAALISEVRGGSLQPGAFVGTNVVANALSTEGSDEQKAKVLPALVGGEEAATWALTGPGPDGDPTAGVTASRRGEGYSISGRKAVVHDANAAGWILVTCGSDEGPSQFLLPAGAPGMEVKPMDGLDLTRRFCEVSFETVELPADALVGGFGAAAGAIEQQLQIACALAVAESVGAMDRDFEIALQYAKDRIAFGRPIGSFQAIKHMLADTSLLLEMSKAMARAAALAVGAGQSDAGEVASMAKAFVGESAMTLAQNCFQTFGGIGYTWEHDQHLYLRRLAADATLYGDPDWHRERLCRLKGL
jgi:alkylation response protein AidB-like acyl-CoA dehydrogenase